MTARRIETTDGIDLWCGDARDAWVDVAVAHETGVHAIVTSPPYFRLRDYGHPAQVGMEDTPDIYAAELTRESCDLIADRTRQGVLL